MANQTGWICSLCNGTFFLLLFIGSIFMTSTRPAHGQETTDVSAIPAAPAQPPAQYPQQFNIVWDTPSADSTGSLPLGNGDIALNAWVDELGDLLFYIGKTDAWDAHGELVKVGKIRVRFTPALVPVGAQQVLSLPDGSFRVTGKCGAGEVKLRLWVDANHPVIRLDAQTSIPASVTAELQTWRTEQVARKDEANGVLWYQYSQRPAGLNIDRKNNAPDPISGRGFGGVLHGEAMEKSGTFALKSAAPASRHALTLSIFSTQAPDETAFRAQLRAADAAALAVTAEHAWPAHEKWWRDFWNRSWILVTTPANPQEGETVSRAYNLQRFVTACAGRGAFPIKFNGSIFTMDGYRISSHPAGGEMRCPADFRNWGKCYWLQNTRFLYWPLLASGDHDMMTPFFKMYAGLTAYFARRSAAVNGHPGAEFFETVSIYGEGRLSDYTRGHWNGGLEILSMLIDYYACTGDKKALEEWLRPMASAYLQFYDQHYKRENGKLKMTASHALETYWKVEDPAPDIAGLQYALNGLLRLSPEETGTPLRELCTRLRGEIPPLPVVKEDWASRFRDPQKKRFLWPSEATSGAACLAPARTILDPEPHNSENPELYPVFPYRLYGAGKPDLAIARETFARRLNRGSWCWHHDHVHAAVLGLASAAKKDVLACAKPSESCRFPAFWGPGHDYTPDGDHGGALMLALQQMLLQPDADKLRLLPAWPKDWNVDFRLHAPGARTVRGVVQSGKLTGLTITPQTPAGMVELFAAQ